MTAPAIRGAAATAGATNALEARLKQELGKLTLSSSQAVVFGGITFAALALGIGAAVLADGRWMTLPRGLPLLFWLLAIVPVVLGTRWMQRYQQRTLSIRALAGTVEEEMQLRAGSLRGALEVGREGVLGARAAADVAARLSPGTLAPKLAKQHSQWQWTASILALVLVPTLILVAGRFAADGGQAVLHPIRAWRGLLLPALAFDGLPTSVPRGMPLTVRVSASGRTQVTVSRRAAGEAWRDTTLSVNAADGTVQLALGPVRAPVTLRLSDGRAPSTEATVTVADRGWIGDVALFAQYPAYLQRANETVEPVPPILVPRGTHVKVSANLRGGARDAFLTDGKDTVRFSGDTSVSAVLTLDRDSKWTWVAASTARDGAATLPTELPDPLAFSVVPDRSPEVVIRAPVTDTAIGTKGVVPIIVQASDDHNVSNIALQLWRESATGTPKDNALLKSKREFIDVVDPQEPIFMGGITVPLDGRDLQPGDKLHVVAIAVDDSPWRQTTVSPEIILRVPSLSEQRAMARDLADSLAARAAAMAAQEKRLQQNTSDASRSRDLKAGGSGDKAQGSNAPKNGADNKMSFAAAEKAKQLGRDQQKLSAKVDSLRANAKELEERLKNAGALDTALASRMRDVQKMLRDAMSPEMQKQLQSLEKSSERLSGTEAQQSMEQLAAQQQQMREQLEKSAEMLKRAALEGAMSTLRDDARDLAKAEQQLADRMDAKQAAKDGGKGGDPSGGKQGDRQNAQPGEPGKQDSPAMDPKTLAERTKELEAEIEKLSKRLESAGAKPGASKTKAAQPMVNQAADAMQKAAEQVAEEAANESAGAKPQNGKPDPSQQGGEKGQPGEKKEAGQNGQPQPGGQQGQPQPGQSQQGQPKPGPQGQSQQGQPKPGQQGESKDGQQGQPGQQGEKGGEKSGQQGGGGGGGGGGEARKAADAMDKAAKQLSAARESQVDAWKTELSQELDQSINETMQLARQQQELEQKARQQGGTQGMQGEQGALQQGVQQAAERLEKAGRSSSLLSQRSQKAMADAQRRVQNATQQMANQNPGGADASQQAMKDASEALNQALSSLVRDREKVNNAQSASGFTEMMEQLKQLAQQQGNLNGQMQGLNLMPGGAQGQVARNQARVLARQQREVAKTLSDVSDADATGRTDALAKEAQTLAQQMERGSIDPNVAARQQQLYRRLLDAGRFLEQDEKDDQGPREAKAAAAGGKGAIDGPQSGKAANKFAPPTWNELRGLGADERRLVIEYFRRLNGTTPQ